MNAALVAATAGADAAALQATITAASQAGGIDEQLLLAAVTRLSVLEAPPSPLPPPPAAPAAHTAAVPAATAATPAAAAAAATATAVESQLDDGEGAYEYDPYDDDDDDQEASQLGEGTFGTTHRMRSKLDGHVYAVKMLDLPWSPPHLPNLPRAAPDLHPISTRSPPDLPLISS